MRSESEETVVFCDNDPNDCSCSVSGCLITTSHENLLGSIKASGIVPIPEAVKETYGDFQIVVKFELCAKRERERRGERQEKKQCMCFHTATTSVA